MKILEKEITGTQTSFFTNVGGKLSFIFPERLSLMLLQVQLL
jgi:hypothetical protein